MGLTLNSVGYKASKSSLPSELKGNEDHIIALAGNPNVGKSTVFNGLTGMKQHTGNWPGKTVASATENCEYENKNYLFVDLPGTYSLMAHSAEEEVARDYICFGNPDLIIVVCDATSLERNLNLVLQTMEITNKVLVCVNLMNEAQKKHITLDLEKLENLLGIPVIGINALKKKDLNSLMKKASYMINTSSYGIPKPILYPEDIEEVIKELEALLQEFLPEHINNRWIAMKLLEWDDTLIHSLNHYLDIHLNKDTEIMNKREKALESLQKQGVTKGLCEDVMILELLHRAEIISKLVTSYQNSNYDAKDRKMDRILTGKRTGFPIMILLLLIIFWLTISGANYPSQLLFHFLFYLEDKLMELTAFLGFPEFLQGVLIQGAYRVLAWVVSVMLPPMAIFFPLFTLLEDLGYLPRIAFNLDHYFKKACTCGKQSLTMCMGFGCNAAGVTGCRIIDSPRERLIAILTNNFVPCNGRFPTILSIITMFFVTGILGFQNSSTNPVNTQGINGTSYRTPLISDNILKPLLSALILTSIIVLGVLMTFIVSFLLSKTILKGVPSSFTLELPPYRKPQIGKIIIHSIFDRTLYVLGRAVIIAAPAGFILWLVSNIHIGGTTILSYCTNFLDPIGKLMGLDGVILMAFILGFPANEIVLPIIIMTYLANGTIMEFDNLTALRQLLVEHGWTSLTAICVILFSLMHWPCSTTCLTIQKETGSLKWTALAIAIPTLVGFVLCTIVAAIGRFIIYII